MARKGSNKQINNLQAKYDECKGREKKLETENKELKDENKKNNNELKENIKGNNMVKYENIWIFNSSSFKAFDLSNSATEITFLCF
jgi:predicted nuclease with TOPRIM domain